MTPETIYAKTAKGAEEISRRTFKLPARLRALLITIDGQTPAARIISRSASPTEAVTQIAALLEAGFIEATTNPGGVAAAAVPVAPTTPTAPVAAVEPLPAARKFMITSLVGALGPDADLFTGKVEAARSLAELAALAEKYTEVIRAGGGGRKAEAFRNGLRDYGISVAATAAVPQPVAPQAVATPAESRQLNETKKTIVRFLLDTLGPDADHFTGKVEAAATITELKQLAARHLEVIRAAAGARRAEEFRTRVIDALNS